MWIRVVTLALLIATISACPAGPQARSLPKDEEAIVRAMERFFATGDADARRAIAREIASNAPYDQAKVGAWLHACALHEPLRPGLRTVTVTTAEGGSRQVVVRVPKGYTPAKPWPLVLAYHWTGGDGEGMVKLLEKTLGSRADEFVLAAPTDYLPLNVDSKRSWIPEHRALVRELKRLAHVDSDRVYVTGFSQGGYAAWSCATFYADELAGAVPVACTYDAAPEIPGLWELLMPNLSHVPVLHVWGSKDELAVLGLDLSTVTGRVGPLNERVRETTKRLGLDVVNHRVEGGGHSYEPPRDLLSSLLGRRRERYPASVRHRFRYLVQGRAYWLEALSWDGDQWGIGPRRIAGAPGDTKEQAIGRMISELAGALDGEVRGQEVRVDHRHVGDLVVWFGEGMVDWARPVRVVSNGRTVFEGALKPDLFVCLSEAARTYDFDRLRWAGLRLSKDGRAEALTGSEGLPEIVSARP